VSRSLVAGSSEIHGEAGRSASPEFWASRRYDLCVASFAAT
jgi:hypothetical protein